MSGLSTRCVHPLDFMFEKRFVLKFKYFADGVTELWTRCVRPLNFVFEIILRTE